MAQVGLARSKLSLELQRELDVQTATTTPSWFAFLTLHKVRLVLDSSMPARCSVPLMTLMTFVSACDDVWGRRDPPCNAKLYGEPAPRPPDPCFRDGGCAYWSFTLRHPVMA